MKWNKVPRKVLPRAEYGVDWGKERPLLLDAKTQGRLFWVPGHTAWVSRGQNGYYEGKLEVQFFDGYNRMNRVLLEGGRCSAVRLNAPEVRAEIALRLKINESDLPQLHPKFTFVLDK